MFAVKELAWALRASRLGAVLGWTCAALVLGAITAAPTSAFQFLAKWGTAGSGDGQLNGPFDLAVNPDTGSQYIADQGNNRIVQFDANGGFVRSWGGTGTGDTQFSGPGGIAVDGDGNVWVTDDGNNRVKKFDGAGRFLTVFGTTGTNPGQLSSPDDVAVDADGNFYVVDQGGRVQKFTSTGAFVILWSAPNPTGIAIAGSNLYVVNYNAHTLLRFDTNGNPLGTVGGVGAGAGQFDQPWHLGVDLAGNVYVTDRSNNRVQKFDPAIAFIHAFGWGVGNGNPEFQICTATCQAGIFGTGDGQFGAPAGVGVDCRGNVYVVEQGGNRVQKFGEPGSPPPPCPAGAGPAPSPARDTTAPVITALRVSPKVFAVDRGGRAAGRKKRVRRGTRISYRLSEAAAVTVTAARKTTGRRVRGKCRVKSRGNRKRRRCTLYRRAGSFRQTGTAGANSKRFSGKIGRRSLKPGPHRLTLRATDAAGNRSKPRRTRVQIVR